MSGLALAMVLASATAHASWNLLAKRAGGTLAFNWLFHLACIVICAPLVVALLLVQRPTVGSAELIAMAGSALIHLGYFILLGQGYRFGDLSLVYPLARGSGPMLATAAAIGIFGERPTPVALVGAALIGIGVFVLAGDPRKLRGSGAGRSVAFALLTGLTIAAYTLWDKHAVSTVGVPPLLYFWGTVIGTELLFTPLVLARREPLRAVWREHRLEVLGTATLVPVAYVLVLTALSFSPVSYVAPAREIGSLFGVLMGARLLAEQDVRRRLVGAAAMVLGVVALAVG